MGPHRSFVLYVLLSVAGCAFVALGVYGLVKWHDVGGACLAALILGYGLLGGASRALPPDTSEPQE